MPNPELLDSLKSLEHTVTTLDITHKSKHSSLWSGADVCIVKHMPVENYNKSHTYVVTEYARELSWLFEELRDIFTGDIADYFSKYEFYGKLAEAANAYLNSTEKPTVTQLLMAVLNVTKTFPTKEHE